MKYPIIHLLAIGLTSSVTSAQSWQALGSGSDGTVEDLALGGVYLYACGSMSTFETKWNGGAWSNLGAGMGDNVPRCIYWDGVNLYAGGSFTTPDGVVSANRVAKWNGSSWSALGGGMSNGIIEAIVSDGTNLYIGGSFTIAGGSPANYLAKWDGSTWSAVGASTGVNATVFSLAWDGTNLYAGGDFTSADGNASVTRIGKWNGSAWSALGSGATNGSVLSIALNGSDLYAGGGFTTIYGVSANRVAKWDGSSWSALGSGFNSSTVYDLVWGGGNLYAGGGFTFSGASPMNRVSKWDGSSWNALGSGMNSTVFALAWYPNCLYAGGMFTTAGGVAASRIATWGAAPCVTTLPIELLSFNGQCEKDQIKLHWQTASEQNNDYFTIYVSNDSSAGGGFEWVEIGTIKGAGNSSTIRNYEFTAPMLDPLVGRRAFYRLKQTDHDGKYEYFGPISVKCDTRNEWDLILQNTPATEELTGTLFLPDDFNSAYLTLCIYDLYGREINSQQLLASKGSNFFKINLNELSDGVYFIKIYSIENPSSSYGKLQKKFIKK